MIFFKYISHGSRRHYTCGWLANGTVSKRGVSIAIHQKEECLKYGCATLFALKPDCTKENKRRVYAGKPNDKFE